MKNQLRRRTPEECLWEAQAEERGATRGRLKIFLGYASGVGKSFRMLDEARRRRERGQDVVVAAMQRVVPTEVTPLLSALETIPTKGTAIDVDALLRRKPAVCVIDGLAYTNPPGLRHTTRWKDAEELLRAGISVITSINIQYVDEVSAQVEAITGKHVEDKVPVAFLKNAEEIEVVDAPANPEDTEIRQERLLKLRELALVLAADVVDHQLEEYLRQHGIQQSLGTQERLLVCITPRANITSMLETARTIANRFHGELIVAYVQQPNLSADDATALNAKLDMAREAGAEIALLDGEDAVQAILDFAKVRGITQLFIGHSQQSNLWSRMWGNPVEKLIRQSRGMDVRVFPQNT